MENCDYLQILDEAIVARCEFVLTDIKNSIAGSISSVEAIKNDYRKLIIIKKALLNVLLLKARNVHHEMWIKAYVNDKFDEYFMKD